MKEKSDNKDITSVERRLLKFFFALTDGEKKMRELSQTLGVSLSTAHRYANVLENAGIARIKNKGNKCGRRVALRKNMYFSAVKIGKNTIDILLTSFLPKYECSVLLPYNEALDGTDNALFVKKTLDKLCAHMRAEKMLITFVLSDGACIDESICKEVLYDTALTTFNSKILAIQKQKAQDISTEEIISALVIKMIKNIRDKTVV